MIGWVNLAMAETFEIENSIRLSRAEEPLAEIPRVTSLNDEIPYDKSIVDSAFLYFVASLAAKDDDSDYWAQDYRARYISAVNEASKYLQKTIKDVY